MLRSFVQHHHRPTQTLDGHWNFTLSNDRSPKRPPRRYDRTIHVPSVWERLPDLINYRGQAWFARKITTHAAATRLVFGGVSHTATVFLDGKKVGSHDDAYTPFTVDLTGLKPGEHDLALHVDNTFGAHSALHRENDYYTYGGITRPVQLQHVPQVFIERIAATPHMGRGGKWSLDVAVDLTNVGRDAQRRAVTVDLAGQTYDLGRVTVSGLGTRTVKMRFDGLTVAPWSPASPTLYTLHARLLDDDVVVDDLIVRVGFREVKVQGRKLLLNGTPLRLRGLNRHEEYGEFGCAVPIEAMARDLELFRDLGANFLRTSHYPNDMRMLDLCDEMGICVWEESHARTVDFAHPRYKEQITASTREMVHWHHNHPCIVMWGCLNECDSESRGGAAEHGRVLQLLRTLDPSRPVTYASNHFDHDRAYKHADIVCWNLYAGWYGGGIGDIEARVNELLRWLHGSAKTGGRNKPVILSEFGAGGIPGYRNPNRCKWSEEYQADLLSEAMRVYLNHPDIAGTAIWQFCDVRITPDWEWASRPRTMNNKGVVDEHRRPKLAYDIVKRRHREAATKWDR